MFYKKITMALPWLLLAALVFVHNNQQSSFYPILQKLQNYTFDTYQRIQPRDALPVEIYVVDIDEKSLKEVGQWPWPRNLMAQMLENLFNKGVLSVGLDIVFAEPDGKSPEVVSQSWSLNDGQKADLAGLKSHDDALAEVLARHPIVAGFVAAPGQELPENLQNAFDPLVDMSNKDRALSHIMQGSVAVRNLPKIEQAAQYHGYFGYYKDTDSAMVRHVPLLFQSGGHIYPSLALATFNAATQSNSYDLVFGEKGLKQIEIEGRFPIPVGPDGQYRVFYRKYAEGYQQGRYISAVDILKNRPIEQDLNAAIILVGTSAAGTFDLRSTPLDPVVPGVESHVQIIESMYLGSHLTRPVDMVFYEKATLLGFSVLLLLLLGYFGAVVVFVSFVFVNVVVISTAAYFYLYQQILFDVSFILLALFLLYLMQSIVKYALERASKQAVRRAFGHYLSPEMVQIVSENPEKLKLGGEDKEVTVLFSDIRGFTQMSEGLTPQQLTGVLNRYLTPMTQIIQKQHGTVDKYMGDAVMAFWNAPVDVQSHAMRACASALEMFVALGRLNVDLQKDGLPQIDIGIGIHTDVVTVGNMGSEQRFDYTVMGDGVNLGSRLEGQCKTYGAKIIISQATLNQVEAVIGPVTALYLDKIAVKGKSVPVDIYELLSLEPPTTEQTLKIDLTKSARDAFSSQQWEKCRQLVKSDLFPVALRLVYLNRIDELEGTALPQDWDGVYHAQSK